MCSMLGLRVELVKKHAGEKFFWDHLDCLWKQPSLPPDLEWRSKEPFKQNWGDFLSRECGWRLPGSGGALFCLTFAREGCKWQSGLSQYMIGKCPEPSYPPTDHQMVKGEENALGKIQKHLKIIWFIWPLELWGGGGARILSFVAIRAALSKQAESYGCISMTAVMYCSNTTAVLPG